MTLAEYFSTGPPFEKPIFDAVLSHVQTLGPVYVEPVSVGIFLKNGRTFAELRPKTKWIALSLSLPRQIDHPKIGPKVQFWGGSYYHVFNLSDPSELDERIRDYLAEAYFVKADLTASRASRRAPRASPDS